MNAYVGVLKNVVMTNARRGVTPPASARHNHAVETAREGDMSRRTNSDTGRVYEAGEARDKASSNALERVHS